MNFYKIKKKNHITLMRHSGVRTEMQSVHSLLTLGQTEILGFI